MISLENMRGRNHYEEDNHKQIFDRGGESNHNRITSRLKGAIKEILGDRTSLFLLGIFLLVSIVSIGYSALSSSLMVTGEANFRVREDVRITGIKVLSFENEGYETYTAEYYKDGTKVMVTLPQTNSKVTYEVEIKNTSEETYQLKSINDVIKSNEQMKYEIEGLNLDDIIGPGETKIFQIVVSYQDGTSEVPSENTVTFETRYVFEVFIPAPTGTNFADYLKSLANPETITTYADENGDKQEMYTFKHEATEQTDFLTDYRYIGDSPNNYVYFNCTDDNNVETCEKWRIIGVFSVEDENGKIEERVKIIRDTSIGNKAWDKNDNAWGTASLNTDLNETYYETLSRTAKMMIEDVKYYLGEYPGGSGIRIEQGEDYYKFERGTVYSSLINSKYWIGKIGLMYPSDYLYTYALGVDNPCYTNGDKCYSSGGGTPTAGWVFNSNKNDSKDSVTNQRTMFTWYNNSSGSSYYVESSNGRMLLYEGKYSFGVRPVLYLVSDVVRQDGDGSVNHPYVIYLPLGVSFSAPNGTYGRTKTITIEAYGSDYSHMEVEVRNSQGKMENKSNSNVTEDTYTVTFEEKGTYTILVKAYDKNNYMVQEEKEYVITDNFSDYLISLSNPISITSYSGSTSEQKKQMYTFEHDATEQTGELTDYRYIGNTPNNYVSFNCTDDSDVSTCETWRIIGVFPVDDGTGKTENRVKLMRGNYLSDRTFWDDYNNNWTVASLNTYLNGEYYKTLSKTAQNMVINAKYYLGGLDSSDRSGSSIYTRERGTETYSYDGVYHPTNWVGKIGLIYPSDYVYTYALGVNSTCYNSGYQCSDGLPSNGWIYQNYRVTVIWTITHHSRAREVWLLLPNVSSYYPSGNPYHVAPTLYLTSDVLKVEGDGSKENPYQLAMNKNN